MSPKYFMRECKKIAQANGWGSGYTLPEDVPSDMLRAKIITYAKQNGFYSVQIGHHFPDIGTYTYDDGIIDFVLGAINPLSAVAIELNKAGLPFIMSF